jgi:hypothetical protein
MSTKGFGCLLVAVQLHSILRATVYAAMKPSFRHPLLHR